MSSRQSSIKQLIIQKAVIPIIIAAFIAVSFSFISSEQEIKEVYDAQLVHSARFLMQIVETDKDKEDLKDEISDAKYKYETNIAFRIWFNDKRIVSSSNAKEFGDIEPEPGFSNHQVNGENWRFFVFVDKTGNIKVETSEKLKIRNEIVNYLVISSITPTLILIIFSLLAIWWGIDKGIKPLEAISNEVKNKKADDFSPVAISKSPTEAVPLINSLNNLLSRIQNNFIREREFTDHAAHELRTPMAALKTQTQVLIKKLGNTSPYKADLENLNKTVDRSARLIEQLLSFSRMQNKDLQKTDISIDSIMEDVITSLNNAIEYKNITVNKDIKVDIRTKGNPEAISMLLRNIIDNAIKYNQPDGEINISSSKNKLIISDTGCGISDADKSRIFERFYRADKTNQIGSGLGLSIVEHIAKQHDIKIEISDNKPKGTIITLNF